MRSAYQPVMPRFGSRPPILRARALGQSASDYLVPGQAYTVQLGIAATGILSSAASAVLPSSLQTGAIQSLIGQYGPFSGGTLTLSGVSVSGSTVTVVFVANTGADVLTLGGIAAAVADMLNNVASGYSFTVLGLGSGLGTTTTAAQAAQTPTPTLWNSLKAVLGMGPALPGNPPPTNAAPTWMVVALLAFVGYAAYDSFS